MVKRNSRQQYTQRIHEVIEKNKRGKFRRIGT
jgi:hypothetical protein